MLLEEMERMDCQKKMTCMEDSKWAIAVRAVAVLHVVAALE